MTPTRRLHHKIWGIAWPAILSNASIPLLGLVDTAILGHLENTRYLGAVAIGTSILSFIYWGFSFLRMGTTGLVAKAFGANDADRQLLILLQSVILAVALALAVLLLHRVWLELALQWMQPGETIAPLAQSYAYIRIYSAPAVLITYAVIGWFIGRQNTRWPMLIVILTNLLNIALDFIFIIGLGLKSDGAAYATLVAEYAGCACAIYAAIRQLPTAPGAKLWLQLRQLRRYRELLNSNRHLFVRTICLLFSFAFFTAQSARLGETQLAANAIMLNLLLLAAYWLDGFAYAVEALSGSAMGSRRMQEFYQTVKACAWWSLATAIGLSALFAAADHLLFPLFTDQAPIRALLSQYQWWLVLLPVAGAASYLLDGVFIGTAKSRYMMYTMLLSTLGVYLPAWYLLLHYGNHGLWAAFILFNGARGIGLGICYAWLSKNDGWLRPAT